MLIRKRFAGELELRAAAAADADGIGFGQADLLASSVCAAKQSVQYLTFWRMQLARTLLAESRLSTAAIAERVGYRSEASFGKAFKKATGTGPGAYRRASATRAAD